MGLKCRFCCCNRTATVFIIGVLSLFQAVVMFTLALLAIRVHDCSWSMQGDPFSYGMYLIYFWNRDCGLVNWSKLNITVGEGENVQPVFQSGTSFAVQRTYTIAWWYLILSIYWMVTSVILILSSICKPKTKGTVSFIYILHISATLGNVLIDIVGASLYWNDVKNTGSIQEFLRFLELLNVDEVISILPNFETHITRLPSFLMMIVAARLFIFPVVNVWFAILTFCIWMEILSSMNRKSKEQNFKADETETPAIIPAMLEDQEDVIEIQPSSYETAPPTNAAEAMKTAVMLSVNDENLEPEIEQRPISGFNNSEFVKKLDGIVEQGVRQYQETGTSNYHGSVPSLDPNPEEDPRVWTGLLYPSVPTVVGAGSDEKKEL